MSNFFTHTHFFLMCVCVDFFWTNIFDFLTTFTNNTTIYILVYFEGLKYQKILNVSNFYFFNILNEIEWNGITKNNKE